MVIYTYTVSETFAVLKKKLGGGTSVLFWGPHLYPCFGLQRQSGFPHLRASSPACKQLIFIAIFNVAGGWGANKRDAIINVTPLN